MTAHVHDPAAHGGGMRPQATRTGGVSTTSSRPRWLMPGLVVAVVAGGLVVTNLVSLSTVVYAGLIGGMILMHAGGHGGGDHGGGSRVGRGHSLHGDLAVDLEDLSRRSSVAQPAASRSRTGLEERGHCDSETSETDDHDQHSSHGCH